MLDVIDLARNASQNNFINFEKEPLMPEAQPAMMRQTSQPDMVRIQVPIIAAVAPKEESKEIVMINTCDPAIEEVYEPPIAFCEKTHKDCGHACKGVTKERKCLPCLNSECAKKAGLFDGVNEDELCTICYT